MECFMAHLWERALRCHGDLRKIINKTRKIHITQFRALKRKSKQYIKHDGKSMQWNKWDFDFNIFLILHTHPGLSYYQCCCFGELLGSWGFLSVWGVCSLCLLCRHWSGKKMDVPRGPCHRKHTTKSAWLQTCSSPSHLVDLSAIPKANTSCFMPKIRTGKQTSTIIYTGPWNQWFPDLSSLIWTRASPVTMGGMENSESKHVSAHVNPIILNSFK